MGSSILHLRHLRDVRNGSELLDSTQDAIRKFLAFGFFGRVCCRSFVQELGAGRRHPCGVTIAEHDENTRCVWQTMEERLRV